MKHYGVPEGPFPNHFLILPLMENNHGLLAESFPNEKNFIGKWLHNTPIDGKCLWATCWVISQWNFFHWEITPHYSHCWITATADLLQSRNQKIFFHTWKFYKCQFFWKFFYVQKFFGLRKIFKSSNFFSSITTFSCKTSHLYTARVLLYYFQQEITAI